MATLRRLLLRPSRRRRHHSTTTTTATTTASPQSLSSPTFAVFGANTGVGKTLVSAGLVASLLSSPSPSTVSYLKPLQTGFPSDSDSRFVFRRAPSLLPAAGGAAARLVASNHTLFPSPAVDPLPEREDTVVSYGGEGVGVEKALVCRTMYAWREAVSPHLAAEREGMMVEDEEVRWLVERWLAEDGDGDGEVWKVLETAGGVASPGPSGTLQCDLYRSSRLPAVLVGDGRLGGISSTLSAYETLLLRGYDVGSVILEDRGLSNDRFLYSYLRKSLLKDSLQSFHSRRIQRLNSMQRKSKDLLWWPFTQHDLVPVDSVTVKDKTIVPQFDACASWWTQGPDSNLQIELARDMGYAAARYGHVMFPENVHEPSLRCAELLLSGVGKDWASRVYFSDNGSTAIEIALKMAFRKYASDHGILVDGEKNITRESTQFKVLALNGSYHGDTLGAMEAQAPSAYTSFLQQPWYSGRGLFLDPPTVYIGNKTTHLSIPPSIWQDQLSSCDSLIQGAGGMHMIDPLFQRLLIEECKKRKIPVIFDEVFTGFWRLGVESASELLGCLPDISCYAKLMTGGIVPLAATLATEAVFEAFRSDSKLTALLHGHSYTAHPMGCTAAVKAIQWYKDPSTNSNFDLDHIKLKELWDSALVNHLSSLPNVKRVVSLGTLCAIELKAEGSDAGYASLHASSLVQQLRQEDNIYARPLGNVIYLMCGPCTTRDSCTRQLTKVQRRLENLN
uniref:Dethiobiotin synthase n=1 Tax=Leersia perrieri TaxID=77586 RepID=A0A0D9X5S6_9ORYZ